MKVDSNPLTVVDAHFIEPLEVLMIEATDGLKGEQTSIIDLMAALTIKATDYFENEQVVITYLMVATVVETSEGLKNGNDNLPKPREVMVVDIAEEPEGNQGDKKKMDCETKNEELSEEKVVELMKVVFPKHEEELVDFLNRCKLSNSRFMLCPN